MVGGSWRIIFDQKRYRFLWTSVSRGRFLGIIELIKLIFRLMGKFPSEADMWGQVEAVVQRKDVSQFSEKPTESTEKTRVREIRSESNRALDMLGESLRFVDPEHAAVWDVKRNQEWVPAIFRASSELAGSVQFERPDLVEPLAMLARIAFRRMDPESAQQDRALANKNPDFARDLEVGKQFAESSRRAFIGLTDRYSPRLSAREVTQGNFEKLLKDVGLKIAESSLRHGHVGGELFSMNLGELSPVGQLTAVDQIIEQLADSLGDSLMMDVGRGADGLDADPDEVQKTYQQEGARVLPNLRSLVDIRAAMSRKVFGHEKSANDVAALVYAQQQLKR
jgi:hypothetical protein